MRLQKQNDMNYNDIDNDIIHYAKRGLDINELFKHHNVKEKHYIPLLLLMPDDAERRNEVHQFLELFEADLKNDGIGQRERNDYYQFVAEKIKFVISFTYYLTRPPEGVQDNCDFDVSDWMIIDTELPNDVQKWLEKACEEILGNYARI